MEKHKQENLLLKTSNIINKLLYYINTDTSMSTPFSPSRLDCFIPSHANVTLFCRDRMCYT